MDLTTIPTTNRLLPGIEHRPTELGRIRLGDKAETKQGKEYPVKLETWRLTSGNRAALAIAANIYGGTVEAWTDAPDDGMWELLTDSNILNVLIPRDLRTLSQWYEWWQGGTCERRCDGTTEQISQLPCLCKAEGTMECRPRTRLNIMLPDIPGLGVWRLETDGWNAATSLPATIEMLLALSIQPWVKAVLRLEQRSAKKRQEDGKVVTHRFAVPVLDTPDDLTLGRIVGQRMRQEQPQQLPETVQEPQTARERVAAQRAEIEARNTSGRGAAPVGPGAEPVGNEGYDEPPHPAATTSGPGDRPAAGASTDTPRPVVVDPDAGRTGGTQGLASSTPEPGTRPAQDDSGAAPLAPESSTSICGAVPPDDDPLGLASGGPCQLSGGHRVHRNNEGTWPVTKETK